MISFAVRIRQDLPESLLLNDAEVARLLGCARSSIWVWLDAGEFPEPKRIGKFRSSDGRQRSGRTVWHRHDIELFARCRNMAEFRRLKQEPQKQ
jgi:predicted DNA-binding transcriptional regulator AlpA